MKSNNWNVLKEKLVAQESDSSKKRKRTDIQDALKNKYYDVYLFVEFEQHL